MFLRLADAGLRSTQFVVASGRLAKICGRLPLGQQLKRRRLKSLSASRPGLNTNPDGLGIWNRTPHFLVLGVREPDR